MADVNITISDNGLVRTFNSPNALERGMPFGEIIWSTNTTIAEKDALDQQQISLQLISPANYIYQLIEMRVWARTVGGTQPAMLSRSIECRLTDGGVRKDFALFNQSSYYASASSVESWESSFTSVTLDTIQLWEPVSLPGQFYGPTGAFGIGADQPAVIGFLLDVTADDTLTYELRLYARALIYTVEQQNDSRIYQTARVTP